MGKHAVSMMAAVICLASLLNGCTIHLIPSKIPSLDTKAEGSEGRLENVSVSLINAQGDDSDFSVKNLDGKDTGWALSRKLWTEKLREALEAELIARQVKVVGGTPVTISLKVTEVVYTGKTVMGTIPFRVTASATSSLGWAKTYLGNGDASAWVPAGMKEDSNWNRAANWTIRDVVLAIMSDPEFIAEISKQK